MKHVSLIKKASSILLLFCGLLSGCATTDPNLKRQADAKRNLGVAYMREGNYYLALKTLQEAQKMNPDDPMVYKELGDVFMAREKYDLAIDNFHKAIKLKPDLAPAINNLGNAYLRVNQWDAAIEQFEKLTSDLIYATPHFPVYGMGIAYFNKKDWIQAEKYFKEALKLQPRFYVAQFYLGRTYMETNRVQEAREALNDALSIDPKFTPAYMALAQSYLMTGDVEKARSAFRAVIEIDPDSPLAKKAETELNQLPY